MTIPMKKLLPFLLFAPLFAQAQPLGTGTYKYVEWGVHGGADIRKMLVIEVLPNSRYCLLSIMDYKEDKCMPVNKLCNTNPMPAKTEKTMPPGFVRK